MCQWTWALPWLEPSERMYTRSAPYFLAHRLGHPVDDPLQTEVLLGCAVTRHLLFGRDERVPILRRIHGQEDDGSFVFVDDVMVGEGRVPRHDAADETSSGPDASDVGVQVGHVTLEHYLLGAKVPGWFLWGDMDTIIHRNAGSFKFAAGASGIRSQASGFVCNLGLKVGDLLPDRGDCFFDGNYVAGGAVAGFFLDTPVLQGAGRQGQAYGHPDQVRVLELGTEALAAIVIQHLDAG